MDDAIHVQVEVVKLYLVRVGLSGIHWNCLAAHHLRLHRGKTKVKSLPTYRVSHPEEHRGPLAIQGCLLEGGTTGPLAVVLSSGLLTGGWYHWTTGSGAEFRVAYTGGWYHWTTGSGAEFRVAYWRMVPLDHWQWC